MYDEELLHLEALTSNHSETLVKLKREWYGRGFGNFQWPTLHITEEDKFIIHVPFMTEVKVQYIPFIYGGLTVEILT